MIEGHQIDAVFTDDESELVTIISGLEDQAISIEGRLKSVKEASTLMTFGAAASCGLAFLENGSYEKPELLIVSAGLVIGGFERLFKERSMVKSIRRKNQLANRLKRELEPTDLERYEERGDFVLDEDDDEEGFYFA
jgi:hypothetical protein